MLPGGSAEVQSQGDPYKNASCGTELTAEDIAEFRARTLEPKFDPFLSAPPAPYCIPVVAHIVRRDNGTGGLPLSQLDQAMIDLNVGYANTGMVFYLVDILYIDDTDHYENINSDADIDALISESPVADVINVYFTEVLQKAGNGLCGRGSFTTSTPQGIAMANDCSGTSWNPSTFPHEVGHFFDLFHTHETANGDELVDGSNCGSAGDLLCDTPADPRLITDSEDAGYNCNSSCVYFGTETDANDDSYNPDTSQMMSYAPKTCRTVFSPLSEARAVNTLLVERPNLLSHGCPPEADAGGNVTAECESPTTTAVLLDGSGSSDPDNDPLTFLWEASGITWDDDTLEQPTGNFPMGTTEVTLTVSDGFYTVTDVIEVTVEDTTAPVISCPANITVECVSHFGTPIDDPQLVPFFTGASAVDACDTTPAITNNAPLVFALGTTTVTFTATDDDGNFSTCMADVIVEDTSPPEISVLLDRDVLWPPNHKMSDIGAAVGVTDICDPNPTFVLTSITSNQADNSRGDGNTTDDIQGANYGTDDTDFQLRSERKGGDKDGRKYSILYTASDASGNTADSLVCVIVPHDQSGGASASSGFVDDGTALDPWVEKFSVLVISQPHENPSHAFDATTIDANRAYVGNLSAVWRPVEYEIVDLNDDQMMDIRLVYNADPVRNLVAAAARGLNSMEGEILASTTIEPVGLHYVDRSGTNYLVGSIFDLGAPLIVENTPGGGKDNRDIMVAPEATVESTGLKGIYPNPFNPRTTIEFNLASAGNVTLRIFDAAGRHVRTLQDGSMNAGLHQVEWNGTDNTGRGMATGVYFARLEAGEYRVTQKMVLIK